MDLLVFIQQYFDQSNVGDTDQNKGQCVGLIEVWTDALALPHTWGNAKDLLNDADQNSFDVIVNEPNNFPVLGDIMVWGSNWGFGFGHTGIVIAADSNIFATFEQNNPTGHTPQLITHTYDNTPQGTLGWLHPKNVVINQQQIIDQLRTERDTNWNLYQSISTKLQEVQIDFDKYKETHPPVLVASSAPVVTPDSPAAAQDPIQQLITLIQSYFSKKQ